MTLTERALTAAGMMRRSITPASEGGADPVVAVRRALTAAAGRLKDPLGGKSRGGGIRRDDWQKRSWEFYEALPEVKYAASFYGANLARVRLIAQEQNAEGEWEEATKGDAFEALDRLRGPRGDRSDFMRAYGEIRFLVGEGYLFGALDQESGEAVWEFLSGDEIKVKVKDDKVERHAAADDRRQSITYDLADSFQPVEGEAVALRLWRPHPRHSADPTSAMAGVLDICEELRLLPRAVRSRARSRLTAGILALPNELTEPSPKPGMDEDPQEDQFLVDLIETASTAISDEDSAAGYVPIVFRGDAEHLDKIQHISFVDPSSAYPETEREVHAIRRLSTGINLPPEVLLGLADSNHWTGWLISESLWTQHLEPETQEMCGDLTSAYMAPQVADPTRCRVWYDASGLVAKPDRSGDAQQAHDRFVISDEALRDAMGFDETAEPDEEELNRRIGVALNDISIALGGEPTPPAPIVNQNGGPPTDEPSAGPSNTEKGPPTPEDEAAMTAAAVRVAVARCREQAGARLLTRLQREPEGLQAIVRAVPKDQVAVVLGRDQVLTLGIPASKLVQGGSSCLTASGWSPALAALVEEHAARTLFDAAPPAVVPPG